MISQRAFVLHVRPYRETSALVDFFTPAQGLIRCVARKSKIPLQPFTPYQITYQDQGELKQLRDYAFAGAVISLHNEALFSGFYLNELLVRTLQRDLDAHNVFETYEAALTLLCSGDVEPVLRGFELSLLGFLGHHYDWQHDLQSGQALQDETFYRFVDEQGLCRVSHEYATRYPTFCFSGKVLKAMARGELQDISVRRAAKRIFGQAIAPWLGDKPLKARELYKQYMELKA